MASQRLEPTKAAEAVGKASRALPKAWGGGEGKSRLSSPTEPEHLNDPCSRMDHA